MASIVNKASANEKPKAAAHLIAAGEVLGLFQKDPEDWFKGKVTKSDLEDAEIEALITERAQARNKKNFKRSDEIRKKLEEQGISLADGKGGTIWQRD